MSDFLPTYYDIGYLYVRFNELFDIYDSCKFGMCENIPNRENNYITTEVKKGFFKLVIEVNINILAQLENEIKSYFAKLYNTYIDAGTEIFKKNIVLLIEPYLIERNISYKILSEDEINNLCRKVYENDKVNKDSFFPYQLQQDVLDKIIEFYQQNKIGKIIWACGLGKALLGIFIVKKLQKNKVVIGVPSRYLQEQMINEIIKIFPEIKILCIGTKKMFNNITFTTNKNNIKFFIETNNNFFIITTYTSCYLLTSYNFDFKIGDEAHHLVGNITDKEKGYLKFHDIISSNTLFMTATEKTDDESNYSMDNDMFGKIIDRKSIYWAIENKKITDYHLMVFRNTESEIQHIINNLKIEIKNNELFMSAFMSLISLEKYDDLTHILIYTNTTYNSDLVKLYIDRIVESGILKNINYNNIYNKSLHCKENCCLEDEVNEFKNKKYGIISCVYIFSEGFDLPKLNGVTFAENMDSNIRIIQSSLRPNRLDKEKPDKIAYIMLPYTEDNDNSFNKVKEIIRKIGNEDEKIECKMKVFTSSYNYKLKEEKTLWCELLQNEDELIKIKLRLRYRKALNSSLSEEQDEFNYVQQINKELLIKSKVDYVKYKLKHQHYILEPEKYFLGIWTNWYVFLGIDTSNFLQTKEKWKKFCKENGVNNTESYYKLYSQFQELLPYEPSDFYPLCNSICIELGKPTRR
jgi:superfamily II DNA or RNA helicase